MKTHENTAVTSRVKNWSSDCSDLSGQFALILHHPAVNFLNFDPQHLILTLLTSYAWVGLNLATVDDTAIHCWILPLCWQVDSVSFMGMGAVLSHMKGYRKWSAASSLPLQTTGSSKTNQGPSGHIQTSVPHKMFAVFVQWMRAKQSSKRAEICWDATSHCVTWFCTEQLRWATWQSETLWCLANPLRTRTLRLVRTKVWHKSDDSVLSCRVTGPGWTFPPWGSYLASANWLRREWQSIFSSKLEHLVEWVAYCTFLYNTTRLLYLHSFLHSLLLLLVLTLFCAAWVGHWRCSTCCCRSSRKWTWLFPCIHPSWRNAISLCCLEALMNSVPNISMILYDHWVPLPAKKSLHDIQDWLILVQNHNHYHYYNRPTPNLPCWGHWIECFPCQRPKFSCWGGSCG